MAKPHHASNLFRSVGMPPATSPIGRRMREAKLARGYLSSLTIDDLDPPEELPDDDPDDALFARGFLAVDLES